MRPSRHIPSLKMCQVEGKNPVQQDNEDLGSMSTPLLSHHGSNVLPCHSGANSNRYCLTKGLMLHIKDHLIASPGITIMKACGMTSGNKIGTTNGMLLGTISMSHHGIISLNPHGTTSMSHPGEGSGTH
eukprot:g33604.t1